MKYHSNAQSTLEYMGIITLVIVGILAMGPHVLRSVNAYFKTASDQARDAYREDLRQADLDDEERHYDMGDGCECTQEGLSCGTGSPCPRNMQKTNVQCEPSTCRDDAAVQCLEEGDPARSFTEAYPECNAAGNYADCPQASDKDAPASSIFVGGGYRCCFDAQPVVPKICEKDSEGNGTGNQLMVMFCGPGPRPQYFWADTGACEHFCGPKNGIASWCNPGEGNYDYEVEAADDGKVYYLENTTNDNGSPTAPDVIERSIVDDLCKTEAADALGCSTFDTTRCKAELSCYAVCPYDERMIVDPTGCNCEVPWTWDSDKAECYCDTSDGTLVFDDNNTPNDPTDDTCEESCGGWTAARLCSGFRVVASVDSGLWNVTPMGIILGVFPEYQSFSDYQSKCAEYCGNTESRECADIILSTEYYCWCGDAPIQEPGYLEGAIGTWATEICN